MNPCISRLFCLAVLAVSMFACRAIAREEWVIQRGHTIISLDTIRLEKLGLELFLQQEERSDRVDSFVSMEIDPLTSFVVSIEEGSTISTPTVQLGHTSELVLIGDTGLVASALAVLGTSLVALPQADPIAESRESDDAGWLFEDVTVEFDSDNQFMMIDTRRVVISESLADELGMPHLAGLSIGSASSRMLVERLDSSENRAGKLPDSPTAGRRKNLDEHSPGPDLISQSIGDILRFASLEGVSSYGVGRTTCNIGTQPALYVPNTNQHQVIGHSLYRLNDQRFEQIGVQWLEHTFLALNFNGCTIACDPPFDERIGPLLGYGCSDYSPASINGASSILGPRSVINAHTGMFPFPGTRPPIMNTLSRKLLVHDVDLDPEQNGGGTYFVEAIVVSADDAAAGNQDNNASYRRVIPSQNPLGTWNLNVSGPTHQMKPAIRAWKESNPSVMETDVRIPGEGLLILSSLATSMSDGWWHYEYALMNLNSDRCAGSFHVPLPAGVNVAGIGFHDVAHHSGEPYDGTDWQSRCSQGRAIQWTTIPHDENPNANAIRWGTLYNFRFASDAPPIETEILIGLFKPGEPRSVTAAGIGPGPLADPPNREAARDGDRSLVRRVANSSVK